MSNILSRIFLTVDQEMLVTDTIQIAEIMGYQNSAKMRSTKKIADSMESAYLKGIYRYIRHGTEDRD